MHNRASIYNIAALTPADGTTLLAAAAAVDEAILKLLIGRIVVLVVRPHY